MKSIFRSADSLVAIFVVVAALTGCAVIRAEHKQHHPAAFTADAPGGMARGNSTEQMGRMGSASPNGQKGMMGGDTNGQKGMMGSGANSQMGMMDKKSMCEIHNKMMTARTPAERTAMMDDRMKNMSPEARQKHIETMSRQCE